MEKILVVRYKAECGRRFSSKRSCEKHETVCVCWTNPKLKTCKTCRFAKVMHDSNGMFHEPQFLDTWRQTECTNNNFDYDTQFTPAHEKALDININCPLWESI